MPRNERLQHQRILRNWHLHDLADQLGVATTTVKRWERGSQHPSPYYRIKLCDLFGLSAQDLGLEAVTSDLPLLDLAQEILPDATHQDRDSAASVEEAQAYWMVPYARNPNFTGRAGQLTSLLHLQSPDDCDQQSTTQRTSCLSALALTGMGGIGKTQIALEYAYRVREQGHYQHIIWINAASEEAILTSFLTVADQLPDMQQQGTDQHQIVAAVRHWFEHDAHSWLLIVDNADDLSIIPAYLPRLGNGRILLTTRAHAVGALATAITVDNLSMEEGTELLQRRTQRLADVSPHEMKQARHIVSTLAQFPLALDQAGAYIEETGCSFSSYLDLYHTHRSLLLARRGKQSTNYAATVTTTWALSLQVLTQRNPAASEFLQLSAFLSPDHIPEELLIEGAPHWPPALHEAVTDPLRFNQMVEDLFQFSLVKRFAEDRLLSLHRLVQIVQRERMAPAEQRLWAQHVVCAVNAVFPYDLTDSLATWPLCQRYLEQALMCDLLIQEHQVLLPEAADLLNRTGTYLRDRAAYALAEPLFQRALRIREQHLGPEHADTAATLNNLAALYWQQGRYAEAEPLFQNALHIREQYLGPEHPLVALALNNLAFLSSQLGKDEQVELLYQRALHIWEQQLEPEHLDVAYALHGLALLYSKQNKETEAERFFQRALHIREQLLGLEHPGLAALLSDFAEFQQAHGKASEAASLYQRVLTIREHVFGVDHPLTTKTREHIHGMLIALGQAAEQHDGAPPEQPELKMSQAWVTNFLEGNLHHMTAASHDIFGS